MYAQEVKVEKEIETPAMLDSVVTAFDNNDSIIKTKTVDFTGDGRDDYICRCNNHYEIWIDADLKIVKTRDFQEFLEKQCFVNIDNDPQPEIINRYSYPEGVDDVVYKQNFVTGKDSALFFSTVFVINDKKELFWFPYTENTTIITKKVGNQNKVYCSLANQTWLFIEEAYFPEDQELLPILFFSSPTTENLEQYHQPIDSLQWLSIDEIVKGIKK